MKNNMLTYEELIEYVKKALEKRDCFDGRDIYRVARFLKEEDLAKVGLKKDQVLPYLEYTRKNVMKELESDLDFAFEKALGKRGISASCMFYVIKMWNEVLRDGLENWSEDNYAQYGLPLLKATALKYKFDNPIGDDTGSEDKYSMESGWYHGDN